MTKFAIGRLWVKMCLMGLTWMAFSCRHTDSEISYPKRQTISESVYASGTVKAVDQYEAYTLANGSIQELLVAEGDTVSVGTPILQIYNEAEKLRRENAQITRAFTDQQANQNRLRDLELSMDLAKSTYLNDSLLFQRQKNLQAKGIGTAVELEQRELKFKNSKTAYESIRLRYQDLKRELEYNSKNAGKNLAITEVLEGEYLLKSKIDGVVYSLLKEKGEMASPQTPLAIIGRAGEFILELQVDEYDIAKIEKGQKVLVTMDSFKGEVFEAIVSKINPIMDVKSKTFTVEATFTKAPPRLYPNLSLEANIITQVRENSLVIPRQLLFLENKVITTDEDTLTVKVGLKTYQYAEILEGIDEKTGLIQPIR
jgi:multidrug efflux pump subunit AcrA (membrane-fusion protein)